MRYFKRVLHVKVKTSPHGAPVEYGFECADDPQFICVIDPHAGPIPWVRIDRAMKYGSWVELVGKREIEGAKQELARIQAVYVMSM